MSARLLTTADADAWNEALPAELSAFGSLGFARAQERAGVASTGCWSPRTVRCTSRTRSSFARLPTCRSPRSWPRAPGTPHRHPSPGRWRAPISARRPGRSRIRSGLLADEGVVAEFAHLHPWNARPELVGGAEADREIVWVDATLEHELLWRESYSKACRKNVKRAEREGVTVRAARDVADVAEFHRIYIQTMERNEALGRTSSTRRTSRRSSTRCRARRASRWPSARAA